MKLVVLAYIAGGIALPAYAIFAIYAASKRNFAHLLILTSAVTHVVGMFLLGLWAQLQPPPPKQKPMELVMIEVKPPPPPPPPEEKKEEPPPKPPPIKVAKVNPPKEIPKEQPPPPPNEEPPPQEEQKPVPVIVGISMSSTSTTGNFNAPVGNTMYGKNDEKAAKPEEVKAYVAPKYMPVYQVDTEPQVISEFKPEYPEEARKAGIEGAVIVSITVDNEGRVVSTKLVRGLGYGLDEAALEGLKKFKFKPAIKSGEAVSTTFNYKFNFWLD